MAGLADILLEESKKAQDVILFFRNGAFYRAYNHSAYLFWNLIEQFKVFHKINKSTKQEYYFVGAPEGSMLKYIAGRQYTQNEQGDIVLRLDAEKDNIPEDLTYEEWIAQFANEENGSMEEALKEVQYLLPKGGPELYKAVYNQIVALPLEQMNSMECQMFLYELRKQIFANKKKFPF